MNLLKVKNQFSIVTSDANTVSSVSIWDGCTGCNLYMFEGYTIAKSGLVNINDNIIGCADGKSLLQMWKICSEKNGKVLSLPSHVKVITYSPKYKVIACFLGTEVYIWNAFTGVLLTILSNYHNSNGAQILFHELYTITVDESGRVIVWSIDFSSQNKVVYNFRPFDIDKCSVHLLGNSTNLFLLSNTNKYKMVSILDGKSISPIVEHPHQILSVVSQDNFVYLGCKDAKISVFDADLQAIFRTYNLEHHLEIPNVNGEVTHLALSPDGDHILVVFDSRIMVSFETGSTCVIGKPIRFPNPIVNFLVIPRVVEQQVINEDTPKMLFKDLKISIKSALPDSLNFRRETMINAQAPDWINLESDLDSVYETMISAKQEDTSGEDREKLKEFRNQIFTVFSK